MVGAGTTSCGLSAFATTQWHALMSLIIRRVVTGHDENGRAVLKIDSPVNNVITRRAGVESSLIWSTKGFPVDNDSFADPTASDPTTTISNGTAFRILQLEPGHAQRLHRTDSIDYAVVMQGEVDMELEAGISTRLKAGDVIVQRGTIHNWRNPGPGTCVIAFILIAAKSVTVGGKALKAEG